MATEQNEVRTVFLVVDQASDPLKQITKAAEGTAKSTAKAQKATGGVGGGDDYKAMKEEARARRMRTRALRMEEQQGDILENAVGGLSRAFGVNTGVFGQLAGLTESTGFQMSAFGGKLGGLGSKLVGLGGTLGIVGAAGYALVAAAEGLGVDFEDLGLTFGQVGATMAASARSLFNLPEANAAARAMGYRSEADLKAAKEIEKRYRAEAEMTRQLTMHRGQLGSVGDSAQALHDKAMQLAATLAATDARFAGMKFEDVLGKVQEAQKSTAAAWATEASSREAMAKRAEEVARSLTPLPFNATAEAMARNREVIAGYTESLIADQAVRREDASAFAQLVAARQEEIGSSTAIAESYRRQAVLGSVMEKKATELVHALHGMKETSVGFAQRAALAMDQMMLTSAEDKKAFMQVLAGKMEKMHHTTNWNNARFDIKQAFAEGFDPDRIATAFSNDLAMLGERRMQAMGGLR